MASEQDTFVIERLSKAVPALRTRRMFGGTGIYAGDVFFALIAGDVVYFKVDDDSRTDFETLGMQAFQPFADKPSMRAYYELPAGVLDDARKLRAWVEKALRAARASSGRKTAKKPRRPGKAAKPARGDLSSIGATSLRNLAGIGVRTRADLERKGVVETFLALRERGAATTQNLLYALEGERSGLRADQLPDAVKAGLRQRVRAGSRPKGRA
jgi:DNA transformation protein